MREFEIVLGLVLVASIAQPIARRFDVPVAIAQVVCGLLLSAIPFVATVRLDPELTFTLFVPPLLFWAATTGSVRVRRNARPIFMLATALVLLTTVGPPRTYCDASNKKSVKQHVKQSFACATTMSSGRKRCDAC